MDFGWMPNRHKPGSVIKWPQPHPGMSRLLCYGHQPVPEALTEQSSFFMATLLLTTYPPTRTNIYTVFTLGFHKFIVDLTFLKGPWKNRGAAHEKSRLFW